MQDDRLLILQQQDGTKVECEIIFTYHDNDFKKDYVVFKVKASGELSAATYNPQDGSQGELGPVESDEEWKKLEEVLNDYYDQMQQKNDSSCSCGGSCSNCSGCSGCGEDCDEE
jgi:uncharacterized protein YrzB (UPF0473 family)